MPPLSDGNIDHLRELLDLPDLSGTKYEFVHKLGSGGMATVFLARDRELDRQVAIKIVSLADPESELARRMIRESKIVAQLEHPNVVPIHDVGVLQDGRAFYVMKYVEGVTLEKFV
jgi:eukaryotic-like serine/threonine-protein kinase